MTEQDPQALPVAELLPWHEAAATQLQAAWSAKRLSHALLIQGAEGLGQRSFAAWIARAMLCERKQDGVLESCGECSGCALVDAGTHPDVTWTVPEEGKQQISVDQVRDMCERLSKTSFRQGYKVAIVDPAHQMTPGAANSLLKTLEEPAAQSLIILLTSRPSALLPTVRSRCQKLAVKRPSTADAHAWLESRTQGKIDPQVIEFAGGAPLRALEYAASGQFQALDEEMRKGLSALLGRQIDVTQIASEWADERLVDRLTWLDLWLTSTARAALGGTADLITFPRGPVHLPSPLHALNISGVYSMVDRARALKAQLGRTALQRELAVESWLFALLDTLMPSGSLSRGPRNSHA
jgi:DNA polymerase-3 subunit delta'